MMHRSTTPSRAAKRVTACLLASVCLIVGSPVAASSAASGGGASRSVSATFGDCKNDNSGKHNGYVCPQSIVTDTSGGGILTF